MRSVRDSPRFQALIVLAIFVAGFLAGVQTYKVDNHTARLWFALLDECVFGVFVAECVIKILAEGRQPLSFFQEGWNVFDFLIVLVGLLPIDSGAVVALRLARLLRTLRLVRS